MWFKDLVGFDEDSPDNVRENIVIKGTKLASKVNGRSFQFGALEVLRLAELRQQTPSKEIHTDKIRVNEIVGDAQKLHCDPINQNALFQAASQFNLLEMIDPTITPERGVGIYERDFTQGPACAIACGAGTIYRNYFAPINQQLGQSSNNQIDCLELVGKKLRNDKLFLWEMSNGYAFPTQNGLLYINSQINKLNNNEREELKGNLKIGLQWHTQVTLSKSKQIVSQAYCSALPVSYSSIDTGYWEPFARIILEAAYEATLYCALINLNKTG